MARHNVSEETQAVWGRRSLRWLLSLFVFLFASGLVILLAPFGRGAQMSVLVHTVGGLLFLWPLGVYLVRHFGERWRDRWSHLLLLGWASGILMVAAVASGLVLTVQAAFGRRISYGWDLVHIVAGCALLPILGAHLVTAVRRNRRGEAAYVWRLCGGVTLAGCALTLLSFAGGAGLHRSVRRQPLPEEYSYRYGDNPFSPSLARTDWSWRLDQDHRWIGFLAPLAQDGSKATPEALADFLDAQKHALAVDLDCRRRGEVHVDELDGLEVDRRRIAALEALSHSADRGEGLRRLLDEVKGDLERHTASFRALGGLAPEALAGSQSCGVAGCHEEILAEWEPSAHRYASRSSFFQLIQGAMAEENGAESTRYCAGCHDPIALFSGAKNIYAPGDSLTSPGADEGVSCAACHSIVRSDVQGNANYIMSPPERYIAEDSFVGRFLIRAYPRHHVASYARPLLKTPEFCGACHKQFIDKELNRATRVQLQNQYDAWKGSKWFVPDEKNPQRADAEKSLSCADCHMRLTDSKDPAAKKGKHRHHGHIAANQWLPELHNLPHARKHIELTEQWLRGETVLPEIADRWPGGPPVPIEIEAPETAAAGERITVRVVAENRKVGHTFPTGPLDVIQAWFDVRVTFNGKEILRSGALDEHGFIQPGAWVLKAEGVDRAGNLIDRHNLWDMVGARFRRDLYPGLSDREEYTFDCGCETETKIPEAQGPIDVPEGGGEILITAILRYRKVDQTLLNVLIPDGTARAPVTDMTVATKRIRVLERP